MSVLLALTLVLLAQTDACMRTKDAEYDHQTNVNIQCPADIVRVADSRSTKAWVSWDRSNFNIHSTHPIKGVYQIVPISGASASVRRQFEEGTHYVEYKAVDESGNYDSCSFRVTVKVVRCKDLYSPQFGILTCDANNLQGSQCHVSCIPGYSIVGQQQINCHADGQWSNDTPFCRTTTCPDPGTPIHGHRNCSTATHAYGSTCHFFCSRGYHLQGAPLLVCHANGDATYWSGPTPNCQRVEPPRVDICPADIQQTSGKALTLIEKPEVRFLTSKDREAPHTCTHFGPSGTHNFTIGVHRVTCVAWDPAFGEDASAQCEFSVRIKANPCRTLSKPMNGFLMCSSALSEGSRSHETTCTLFCNRGFVPARTPYTHHNTFACDHTGTWKPSHHVPSCVRPKRPQELKLPSEIYYYSSNCTNQAHLNDVRVKFQSTLQSQIRQEDVCVRSPGDCIVEDVQTKCRYYPHGIARASTARDPRFLPRRRKRLRMRSLKRSSSSSERDLSDQRFRLPILFHLGTRLPETGGEWPDEYHKAHERLFGMFDYFEERLIDGEFTIKDRVTSLQIKEDTTSLTHADKKAICDIGYKFNSSILLCVPCGAGTHYNITEKQCVPCAPGSYQNQAAQFSCQSCPVGTATPEEGASNMSQCVDLDECESNPCLHNGECTNGPGSFTCRCTSGYTGPRCEERVYDCSEHMCLNGGTCVPEGQHNHTCLCRPAYSGFYCQFHTVDGSWGDWSPWSECTKSCEGGVTVRNRTCDSPTPSYGGQPCRGAPTQEKVCNLHKCPKCKRLRRPYQGSIQCTEYRQYDYMACTVNCPSGYDFSGPVEEVYGCGRNTSYLWPHESPDNPRCVIPACTKVTEAEEVNYQFRSSWPVECTPATETELTRQITKRATQVTSKLQCIEQGTCQLNEPSINGCKERRHRRSANNATKEVEVTVTVTYFTRFKPGKSKEKSDLLTKFAGASGNDSIRQIESLGKSLKARGRNGHSMLYIIIDGQKVYANPRKIEAVNMPVCPTGMIPAEEGQHCVECQPGSYYQSDSKTCVLCEIGYYQPYTGQRSCLACSHSQTTYGRGAIYSMECYNAQEGVPPPEIPEDHVEPKPTSQLGVIVGTIVGLLVILLMLVAWVIVALLRKKRKQQRYNVKKAARERKGGEGPEEMSLYPDHTHHSKDHLHLQGQSQESHMIPK